VQFRKLHLQIRFLCDGAHCKNIDNKFLPVDDGYSGEVFPVSLLRGTCIPVEHQAIRFQLFCFSGYFFGFSASHAEFRIPFTYPNCFLTRDFQFQGFYKSM